eukprot:366525-Chlamydomonas_euryale.AAC.17
MDNIHPIHHPSTLTRTSHVHAHDKRRARRPQNKQTKRRTNKQTKGCSRSVGSLQLRGVHLVRLVHRAELLSARLGLIDLAARRAVRLLHLRDKRRLRRGHTPAGRHANVSRWEGAAGGVSRLYERSCAQAAKAVATRKPTHQLPIWCLGATAVAKRFTPNFPPQNTPQVHTCAQGATGVAKRVIPNYIPNFPPAKKTTRPHV